MNLDALFTQVAQRLGGVASSDGERSSKVVPFNEVHITQLEMRWGQAIPSSYRHFMTTHGGCYFGANAVESGVVFPWVTPIPAHISDKPWTHLNLFYGPPAATPTTKDINWQIAALTGSLPHSLLPIADCSGNKVCLGISGSDRERIFYWDRETEPLAEEDFIQDWGRPMTEADRRCNLFLVAESFVQWLNSLRLEPH